MNDAYAITSAPDLQRPSPCLQGAPAGVASPLDLSEKLVGFENAQIAPGR